MRKAFIRFYLVYNPLMSTLVVSNMILLFQYQVYVFAVQTLSGIVLMGATWNNIWCVRYHAFK